MLLTQRKILTLFLLWMLIGTLHGATRLWKNTDGSRSFSGELVKQEADKITIRMTTTGRNVVLTPDQLHADDLEWLKKLRTSPRKTSADGTPDIAEGAFYDTIAFGDDKPTIIRKLQKSKRFNSEMSETFFARTGLNGNFRTTKGNEFFGMNAALYYGWDDNHRLKFLSLYGHETPTSKAKSSLDPLWHQMVRDISRYFGKPKSSSPKPLYTHLGESEITFTHVWPMKPRGSLLLGVGKQEGKYVIIARFTSERH